MGGVVGEWGEQQTRTLTDSPSSPDRDQSHESFLIVPASDPAFVSIYQRWLELSKEFSEKTAPQGPPINRCPLGLLLSQQMITPAGSADDHSLLITKESFPNAAAERSLTTMNFHQSAPRLIFPPRNSPRLINPSFLGFP